MIIGEFLSLENLIRDLKLLPVPEIKIDKLDTPKTLAKKILTQEHKLYPAAIKKVLSL